MKARAAMVGRRLSLGTTRQLETWACWVSAWDLIGDGGFAGFLKWLGTVARRVAACVSAALFYGLLLQRVPGGIYAVPIVWAIGAWQMSDSSATPPPEEGRPSCRECAGHDLLGVTPLEGQKGMLIYKTAPPGRPNHTHIHIAEGEVIDR